MTPALALGLCAGVATAQSTRDQDRRERQEQRQDERQDQRETRQPVDRNHPLWAHPVDDTEQWRPRDRWTRQDSRDARDQMRDRDGADMQSYRAAYWEGYHDGYHDDEFGYDHWSRDWDRQYASAYTDGYYDGYYDQQRDYDYSPSYYLYPVAVPARDADQQNQAERRRAEQKRQEDRIRARGDRMGAAASAGRTQTQQRDLEKIGALKLVRGDVSEISEAERSDHPDHTVLRIKFQDREDVIADFGPHMSRNELPFDRGDRVSLIGYHAKSPQGETIVVSQIAHEGKFYELRGAQETLEDRDRDMDRQRDSERQRDRNRPGGG